MDESDSTSTKAGPLLGVRVLELGSLIAGPFCGQLLADLGADVIKCEPPSQGDPMRQWGREHREGVSLWWTVIGRGKRSVTLDLRTEAGQDVVRRLVGEVDVVIENFRPGRMESWNLGWEALSEVNPRLVMVRVSGYGQTGPYSQRAGFGAIGEAMGGLRYVVGDPSTPPSRLGISVGDSVSALFATIGALAALRDRDRSGRGQVVDAAIYESILALMESLVPDYAIAGRVRERTGATLPDIAPSNVYPTADGETVLIAANQDSVFRRLCDVLGHQELARDDRFATHRARGHHQQELDELVAGWTATWPGQQLLAALHEAGVPAGRVYRAADMLEDEHFAAREAIVQVQHDVLGPVPMQNVFPRLSETPGRVAWAAPRLGEHTDEVLGELVGMDHDAVASLRTAGIV